MAPSAIHPAAQLPEPRDELPPPVVYSPKEAHFENFIEPQYAGYQQAKSRGIGRTAIVIDNGTTIRFRCQPQNIQYMTLMQVIRFLSYQSWMVLRWIASTEPHTSIRQI